MGSVQRKKRYRYERDHADKRSKVYADGQEEAGSYFRSVVRAAKYAKGMIGAMEQIRKTRIKAKGGFPLGQVMTLEPSSAVNVVAVFSAIEASGLSVRRDNT